MPYIMYYDENAHCILKDGNDSINITLEHRKQKQLKNQIIQNGGKKLSFNEKYEIYIKPLYDKYRNEITDLQIQEGSVSKYSTLLRALQLFIRSMELINDTEKIPEDIIYDIKHITRAFEINSSIKFKDIEGMVEKLKKEEEIKRITSKEAIFSSLFSF